MDDFLIWLEFKQWQILVKAEQARRDWAAGFGMATERQCDYFCQLYESAPMPEFLDIAYKKAMARKLPLYEFEMAFESVNENLNNNQPDPRQQLKTMLRAGTMI